HVAHGAFGFGFRLMPTKTAETIQSWLVTLSARIALDQIEPLDRNVKPRFVRVVEQHELAARLFGGVHLFVCLTWSDIKRDQSAEPRDAVIDVHDKVIDLQI